MKNINIFCFVFGQVAKNFINKTISENYNINLSKKIIENFDNEIFNFIQVCPKEMIDKLENPVSLKPIIKEVS